MKNWIITIIAAVLVLVMVAGIVAGNTLTVLAVVLVLLIVAGIIAFKALTFKSRQIPISTKISCPVDTDIAVDRLAKSLQFKTVYYDQVNVDWDQFDRFGEYLVKSFPIVHATLQKITINDHALLYSWKGSDSQKKPILLCAHQDVVPATDEGWTYPPFAGTIADGYIWGRGTGDDKGSLMSIMEAVEYLLKDGFKPTRSIYLAFGFDEEAGGEAGAAKIAEYLKSEGLQFECTLDEGLVTLKGVFPGISQWVDFIGTAEKGFVPLQLAANTTGGHPSAPSRWTSIAIIAAAIDRLERHPFPAKWVSPTSNSMDFLGPETSFPYKVLFANMWLFEPIIKRAFAASPTSDALIRTTQSPRIIEGTPTHATATIVFYPLPGETIQSVIERVKTVINDERVQIQPTGLIATTVAARDPSPVSDVDSWSFAMLSKTIREVMIDVLVTPMLVTGGTDGRYYAPLSECCYRTLPARVLPSDMSGLHGINERISISSYAEMITYYIQLMRNMCQ